MARKEPKLPHLGGIGTMLLQSDLCPSCGQVHESGFVRYFAGLKGASRAPSVQLRLDADPPYAPGSSFPVISPGPRRPSALAIPWPMPPIAGEPI